MENLIEKLIAPCNDLEKTIIADPEFVEGAMKIDNLRDGDRILIAEACSHHPIGDDIGSVKIPRWLRQYTGASLEFDFCRGRDFPENLGQYELIIHCGGCMHNRKQMLYRIDQSKGFHVPITNYGVTIAFTLGVFERALQPFPHAYETYLQKRGLMID